MPIFFIHGITSNVHFWECGQPSILADQLRWYSLSLPGHYPAVFPSAFQSEQLTAEMMAEVLVAAIHELVGDGPAVVAGHSTGGFAALAIAAHTPEIAHGVVSIGGFADGQWTGSMGLLQWLARQGAVGLMLFKSNLKFLTLHRRIFRAAVRLYAADCDALYSWPRLDPTLDACYPCSKQLDVGAMVPYFRRMPDIDISPLLPRIAAPTLVLAGDQDPIVPPAQARLIAEKVPNSELVLLERTGHLVTGERSADYHRIITGWLEKVMP